MANLELNVDPSGVTSGASKARRELRQVASEGRKTRDELNRGRSTTERLGSAYRRTGQDVNRTRDHLGRYQRTQTSANQSAREGVAAQERLAASYRRTGTESSRSSGGIMASVRSYNALGVAVGVASAVLARGGVQSFRAFNKAASEVQTLIPGTAAEMDLLESSAKRLSTTYGGSAVQQVNAFYQAISAGVGGVAEASVFLDTANKLAVGGITDVGTSVDLLTTVTNAYSAENLQAARAADILFTAVKAGKTNIPQLSAALGQIVPISSSVGVGLDEVASGVAALTAQGQSTSQAVTGLRATLSAVIAPTKQAQDAAKALGIEFSGAALKSKGLGGFLEDIVEKTGGSQEAMAKLFGSVEALNAVLAFSGAAGATYSSTMELMKNSTGAADEAFNKVSQSIEQRLQVQLSLLGEKALKVGEVILTAVVPAMEWATSNTEDFGMALLGLGAIALPFAPMIAGVALLAGAIMVASQHWDYLSAAATVSMNYISRGLGLTSGDAASAWASIKDAAVGAWSLITSTSKSAINLLIGSGKAVYTTFAGTFPKLPELVGYAAVEAVNGVIFGIEMMVNRAIFGINVLVKAANAASTLIPGFEGMNEVKPQDLGGIANPFGSALDDMNAVFTEAAAQTGEDYVGKFFEGFDRAVKREQGRQADLLDPRRGGVPFPVPVSQIPPALPPAITIPSFGGSGGPSQGSPGGVSEAERQIIAEIRALEQLKSSYDNLRASVDPAWAASEKFAAAQETVNLAVEKGIISTEEGAETTAKLKDEYSGLNQHLQTFADAGTQFFKGLITGSKSFKDSLKDLAASFADRLLTDGLNMLMGAVFGTGGGGGGSSLLGSLFSAGSSALFSAKGNAFSGQNVIPFAKGGVVGGPVTFPLSTGIGVAGEAGPEAIMPLRRGPDGSLGVRNSGGSGGATNVSVNFNIDAAGADPAAVQRLQREVAKQRAEMPGIVVKTVRQAKQARVMGRE